MAFSFVNTTADADNFTEFRALLAAYNVTHVVKEVNEHRIERYVCYDTVSPTNVRIYIDFHQDVYQETWDADLIGDGITLLAGNEGWRVTDELVI